jgi:Tfp pilus assembly protein PilF
VFVRAIDSLKAAIRRDPAHYRYYHKMSELYQEAAQLNQADAKKLYAQKAEQYLEMALQRHPAKSELLIDYGKLLMEYGKLLEIESWTEQALNALEKALAYEQAFQAQQRQMYPEMMEQRSRLQPIIQEEARRLIKQLQKQ